MTAREQVLAVVARRAPYFRLESEQNGELRFATREGGNAAQGRASVQDARRAVDVGRAVQEAVPGTSWCVEQVDEWTVLGISLPEAAP